MAPFLHQKGSAAAKRIPTSAAPGHSGGATTQWRVLLLGVASSGKQLSEVMSWMSWMTLTMKIHEVGLKHIDLESHGDLGIILRTPHLVRIED